MEEKNISEEKKLPLDLREKVIGKIKEKKIRIKSRKECLLERLGWWGALLVSIVSGALLFSFTFYLFKKTGVLKFLSLGFSGAKVFLATFPYDYLVLFVLSLVLIDYLARKSDLAYQENISCQRLTSGLFLTSIFIGASLVFWGAEAITHGWSRSHLPKETAVFGKIEDFEDGRVLLLENDGETVWVAVKKNQDLENQIEVSRGKFMRAVGFREHRDGKSFFQAEKILCCDED